MKRASSHSLVGAWEGTIRSAGADMKVLFELRDDGTFSESIEEPAVQFTGSYAVDPATKTLTITIGSSSDVALVAPGTTLNQDISIGEGGTTFEASGGGSTGRFVRR